MLHDPAFLHAVRLTDEVHRDVDVDLLVPADDQEVDVEELTPDVITLDLARHREVLVLADVQIDEDVRARVGVEDVIQVAVIDRDLDRVHAVAVQDGRDLALRAQLPRGALPPSVAEVRAQFPLGHRSITSSSGGRSLYRRNEWPDLGYRVARRAVDLAFPAAFCAVPLACRARPLACADRFLVTRPASALAFPAALFAVPFARWAMCDSFVEGRR